MGSTKQTWSDHAQRLRQRAGELPSGDELDRLLSQAEKLDEAIEMTRFLAVAEALIMLQNRQAQLNSYD